MRVYVDIKRPMRRPAPRPVRVRKGIMVTTVVLRPHNHLLLQYGVRTRPYTAGGCGIDDGILLLHRTGVELIPHTPHYHSWTKNLTYARRRIERTTPYYYRITL